MDCKGMFPREKRFISCDGQLLTNESLDIQLKKAIEIEDYEDATIIRDEINRRKGVKDPDEIALYEGNAFRFLNNSRMRYSNSDITAFNKRAAEIDNIISSIDKNRSKSINEILISCLSLHGLSYDNDDELKTFIENNVTRINHSGSELIYLYLYYGTVREIMLFSHFKFDY